MQFITYWLVRLKGGSLIGLSYLQSFLDLLQFSFPQPEQQLQRPTTIRQPTHKAVSQRVQATWMGGQWHGLAEIYRAAVQRKAIATAAFDLRVAFQEGAYFCAPVRAQPLRQDGSGFEVADQRQVL